MAILQPTTINDTGHIKVASGTTAQRPGFQIQMFTATGPGTFTVPTGVTQVDVLVVAGGGGGGGIGGGGGGGGVIYRPALPVTPGGTVAFSVGLGGQSSGGYDNGGQGADGGNSTFGTLTALGGGGGGSWGNKPGRAGGSGGGAAGSPAPFTAGGLASQPSQPGDSGAFGFGFPGSGAGQPAPTANNPTTGNGYHTAGGGGGAGAAGGHPSVSGPGNTSNLLAGRKGGDGYNTTITGLPQFFGGGGGGGSHGSGFQSPVTTAGGGLGGGGRGGSIDFKYDDFGGQMYDFPASVNMTTGLHGVNPRAIYQPGSVGGFGEPGQRNTGGGGGGGWHTGVGGDAWGGSGGPGVIIVRYQNPNTDNPVQGMIRYNTDSEIMEIYDGTVWKPLKRTVVEFKATGSHFFKVPPGVTHCDVLVVAGGGSGGVLGGGGGAGGHLYVPNFPVPPGGVVPVFVGVGGGNHTDTRMPQEFAGRKGQPSRFAGIEAYGGGAGSTHPGNGNNYTQPTAGFPYYPGGGPGVASNGGSGGGAAYTHPGGWGRGVVGQGNQGGNSTNAAPHGCGGGGGAGGVGGNGSPSPRGGNGGVGVSNDITGVAVFRAGGGGGGIHTGYGLAGDGGNGGGGGGGRLNNPVHGIVYGVHQQAAGDFASPGADNTGGGGGGSGHNGNNPYGSGGRGGPGVVIIRY